MKSIFRYPGGKSRPAIREWILNHRPEGVEEYREPFVGGGGIFFGVEPASVKRRWINDKHSGLIAVYSSLLERPDEFIRQCMSVPEPLEDFFEQVKLNEECDQALRYLFVNRTVFAGRVHYDWPSRLAFTTPERWLALTEGRLRQAAGWVAGTKITCSDFEPLFAEPGEAVWIYADPPYWKNTEFSGNTKLYQHCFDKEDHERLAAAIKGCPHNVCLSYDDDDEGFIRSLYPESEGFSVVKRDFLNCGTTNKEKDLGKELLILNYEPRNLFSSPKIRPDSEVISPDEEDELRRLEAEVESSIAEGRKAFVRLGMALLAIQESGTPKNRLYRQYKRTFPEYCEWWWGIGKSRLFQLINAAIICSSLKKSTIVDFLPTHETQIRHLAKLKDEHKHLDEPRINDVWQRSVSAAVASGLKAPTEQIVLEEVRNELGWEPPQKPSEVERILRLIRNLSPRQREKLLPVLRQEWSEFFESSSVVA